MKILRKILNLIQLPHILTFLVIMIAGTFFAILNPLGQETDGDMHFFRSSDVSYGNVLGPFAVISHDSRVEELPGNFNDYAFYVLTGDAKEGKAYQKKLKKLSTTWETMDYYDPRTYCSIYYYPQALGLLIARTIGTTVYTMVIWGHMMNLLCYAILASLAVYYMPIYKNFLGAVTMLPMCVYLAASFSADAMLNGLCFLFMALVFRYAYAEECTSLGIKQMLPLGLLLWLIYTNKYVYAVLGLLVFLIPVSRFGSKKNYWKTFGVALLPIILYIAYQVFGGSFVPQYDLLDVLGSTQEDMGTAGTLYPGMTQQEFVMTYPFEFLKVLVRSIYCGLSDWVVSANTFGWLKIGMEPVTYWLPVVMAGVILFDSNREPTSPLSKTAEITCVKWWHRILMTAAGLILICAVISSIYIFDSASNIVGWLKARGIQGRYFLVTVPLFLMTLAPSSVKVNTKGLRYKVSGIMFFLLMWSVYIFYKHYYDYGILNF